MQPLHGGARPLLGEDAQDSAERQVEADAPVPPAAPEQRLEAAGLATDLLNEGHQLVPRQGPHGRIQREDRNALYLVSSWFGSTVF